MDAAIIHFEPCFSKWDQSVFFNKTIKKIKKTINIKDVSVFVYTLPLNEENPSEKALKRFFTYLKGEKIKYIISSNQAKEFTNVLEQLEENFLFFNGKTVINYLIYDILRKCAKIKEIKPEESTVTLLINDPHYAKEIILKICLHVKRIRIQTQDKEKFKELFDFFLNEYGLFILTDQRDDKEEKALVLCFDEAFNHIKADFNFCGKDKVLFQVKNINELSKLLTIDQKAMEFLIYTQYQKVSNETVKQFFKANMPKIIKIKNND